MERKLVIFGAQEQREFDEWDFTFSLWDAFDRVYGCNTQGWTNVMHIMYGVMKEVEEICKKHVLNSRDCKPIYHDGCVIAGDSLKIPVNVFIKIVKFVLVDTLAHVKLAEGLQEEDFLPREAQEKKAG